MRDVGSGGIRLLGREATLLDREVRAVTRRVDIIGVAHATVLIDGDETGRVRGETGDVRPGHDRQGDYPVGLQLAVAGGEDQAAVLLVGALPAHRLDPTGVQELTDGGARSLAEG